MICGNLFHRRQMITCKPRTHARGLGRISRIGTYSRREGITGWRRQNDTGHTNCDPVC